jgi:hypothetical protein
VKYIHIEGGGSSDGPALIGTDGRLVGTALAGPANLQFAIPAESVGWVLRERIQSLRLGQAVATDKGMRLPVTARVADPLNRLWKLSLDVSAGDPSWAPRSPDGKPKGLIGEFGRQTFSLTPSPNDRAGPGEDRDFVGEIDLPQLPSGKVFWVQPHFNVSRSGQVGGSYTLGDAMPLPDAGPPVERVPVRLAPNPSAWPAGERRLDLMTHRLMNVDLSGKQGAEDRTDTASFEEKSSVTAAGAPAKLHLRLLRYAIDGVGITKQTQQNFAAAVQGLTADVDLGADGEFKSVQPDFSAVSPANRPLSEGVIRGLTGTLVAMNPALGGRNLQPGESWPVESEFRFPSGGMVTKGTFHLTHTYVGSRVRAGRREAIIEVMGEMTPPAQKEAADNVVGRVIGAYSVDISTGQVVLTRVESDLILEINLPSGAKGKLVGSKVGMVIETRFQRGPMDGPPIPGDMPLPNNRIDFRPFVPLPGG